MFRVFWILKGFFLRDQFLGVIYFLQITNFDSTTSRLDLHLNSSGLNIYSALLKLSFRSLICLLQTWSVCVAHALLVFLFHVQKSYIGMENSQIFTLKFVLYYFDEQTRSFLKKDDYKYLLSLAKHALSVIMSFYFFPSCSFIFEAKWNFPFNCLTLNSFLFFKLWDEIYRFAV